MTQNGKPRPMQVRKMTRQEVDMAVAWAAAEGWNPGRHDAACFYDADPNGFFIGLLGDEPVGFVSAVAYDPTFCFMGFFIVRPEYRGCGYGQQLARAALRYAGRRNVGIDGVLAQEESYRKAGFRTAYRNIRYEGQAGVAFAENENIVDLSCLPFKTVLAYDTRHFPLERRHFLQTWLAMPNAGGCAVVNGDELRGYGVIRSCTSGYKIGPLFAEDAGAADTIYSTLVSGVSDGPVYLDVPEVNEAAVTLAERHGMTKVFETARMYLKEAPDLPLNNIFGVTSFELG